jgi:hypothetical protein
MRTVRTHASTGSICCAVAEMDSRLMRTQLYTELTTRLTNANRFALALLSHAPFGALTAKAPNTQPARRGSVDDCISAQKITYTSTF